MSIKYAELGGGRLSFRRVHWGLVVSLVFSWILDATGLSLIASRIVW